jgi:D-serine dehydratase
MPDNRLAFFIRHPKLIPLIFVAAMKLGHDTAKPRLSATGVDNRTAKDGRALCVYAGFIARLPN